MMPAVKYDLPARSINWASLLVISITAIWVLGTIFTFALTVLQVRRLSRIVAQSSIAPDSLKQLMKAAGDRIGTRRVPELRLVDVKVAPLAVAIWKRRYILLPTKLVSTLSNAQITAVLSHELAHFQRKDHWVRRLEVLVSIVYWWNPMIPWIKNQLQEREEEACDALAIQGHSLSAECYANTLLRTLDYLAEPPAVKTMSVASAMAQIVSTKIPAPHSRTSAYANRLNLLFQTGVPKSISLRGYAFAFGFAFLILPWAAGNQPNATTPFSFLFASANVESNSTRDETMVTQEEYAGHTLPKLEINGTVVDENGNAIADALVRVASGFGDPSTARTNSFGKFQLATASWCGDCPNLIVESPEGMLGNYSDRRLSPTIVCKPPHIIMCKVLDSNDKPVDGAAVKVAYEGLVGLDQAEVRTTELTNAKGEVDLKIPADASVHWLFAYKSKVGSDYHETYRSFPPQRYPPLPDQVTFRMTKGNDVKIKVVDSAGKPIKGTFVSPYLMTCPGKLSYVNLGNSGMQATDESGEVTYDWLPAEATVGFSCECQNYKSFDSVGAKTAIENQELVFHAVRKPTIRGKVIKPDGTPAVGMVVKAEGAGDSNYTSATTITNDDGRYEMKVYPKQKILLAANDQQFAARSVGAIELTDDEIKEDVDLLLERAVLIKGRITDQNGDPVSDDGCSLCHIEEGHDDDSFKDLNEDGNELAEFDVLLHPKLYRFAMPNKDGEYSFSVAPGKYLISYPHSTDTELIEVTDQHEIVRNKQIKFVSHSVLKGRTLDADGKPIGNTLIFGEPTIECGYVGFQSSSDVNGEFEASRWNGEMFVLAINQEDNSFDFNSLEPEQAAVDFEMKSGRRLSGTLLNEHGKPESRVRVDCHFGIPYTGCLVRLETRTDESGRYEFRGLPIGLPDESQLSGQLYFYPRTSPDSCEGPDFFFKEDQTIVDLGEFQLSRDDD